MSWQCVPAAQNVNVIPGCIKRSVAKQVEGGDSPPEFSSRVTIPGVLHPALVSPVQDRPGSVQAA